MDLDNFKSINDEYDHMAGDQYLKKFSERFSENFSKLGTLYRISGDEFVFLYKKREVENSVYERIQNYDDNICFGGIPFKGLSVGKASYPDDAETLEELYSIADVRMYQAKRDSQNKRQST